MLTTLRIRNLALVAELTWELEPGLNVVTGETGAGKSILIGALNLVLGERADRTWIRSGADSCTVEAVFDVRGLAAPLNEFLQASGLEPCEAGQLVLKRTFTAAGANRQFVNGSPTTLQVLATLGDWLVDIHGPHDHQSLLQPARQLAILDAFGKLEPLRADFARRLARRAELLAQKAALIVDERTYAQQLDLLRFQVHEIEAARLQPGEDQQLEQQHQRATHAARRAELSQAALALLSQQDECLLSQAGALGRILRELQRLDPQAETLASLHQQAVATWQELQTSLARYAESVDLDPARLQQLEERLNLVQSLKRKYGPKLEDVLAFGQEARRRLHSLEQRQTELERLNTELAALEAELRRVGRELSARRRKLLPQLSQAVEKELQALGFAQSRFHAALTSADPVTNWDTQASASGLDTIEFQFAPNPGEPARPLRAIASSGELARVMLALKTVLAAEDQVPVLIFDEVDANVGGATAHAVGEKMRQIAQRHQVLCVTHLPQVAAYGSTHYLVSKRTHNGRTITEIRRLSPAERIQELARMLGGPGEAARRHAEALLRQRSSPNGSVAA